MILSIHKNWAWLKNLSMLELNFEEVDGLGIKGGPHVKSYNTLTVFGCKRNIMIQELAKLHDHMCESVIRIVRIWMIFLRNPSGIWKWCWVSPTPEKIINNLVNTNIFYRKVHYRISPKQFWKSKIVLYSSENMFLDLFQIRKPKLDL